MKSSRNKVAILFLLFSAAVMAQVGVGTVTPGATLDVTATNLTGTTVDGLLIPRVSRLRAQSMLGVPTSTVVYINDISNGTATGTTVNVTATGFYFFNGTVWERLGSGATNAWSITGNSGLSGTTNFLGTLDNVDVPFRRNNAAAGKIGATSTSFGVNALTNGVATNNAAFGTNALGANTTGVDNVAVGNGTLSAVTTGIQNTAVGNAALATNTGNANTAVGNQALNLNAATSNNTAVGFQALRANIASNNTGIGFQALTNNTGGTSNTALGFQASNSNSSGTQNTAVGFQTLYDNSVGANNTAVGRHALHRNTASNNTAVGHQALLNNTSSTGNTAVGADALRINSGASNTALGFFAGAEHSSGINNTYVGFESGKYSAGAVSTSGNTFLGASSGLYSSGSNNTALGANTLTGNFATANNVAIGYNALNSNQGTGNVAIGYSAGSAETGSNKLYIDNSNADASNALIYGEFNTNIARVNGTLQINNPANPNGYALPNVRGTNGQVLQTNGAGATSWVTPTSAAETDPQVGIISANGVPRWDGAALVTGVISDNGTNVGIGVAPTAGIKLNVAGNTSTTNFQMTSGAANGYILQSDAVGNASWVQNPINTLSMMRSNLSASQSLVNTGWQKINFNSALFNTGGEFNAATGRFTATKAGFYRVNAAYHTDPQSNGFMYSIGVQVNGTFYQITSFDHHGGGHVERSVECLVQLAVGDYIEIFAENYAPTVNIDGYSGKTSFEIQQIR